MATLKTTANQKSVTEFISGIVDVQKRNDCFAICQMMEQVCKAQPKMWGNAIIGFGDTDYVYPDGRTMAWFIMGFSPRKQNFALYVNGVLKHPLLSQLGKYKTGKSCLYINSLASVNVPILQQILIDCNPKLKQQ